MPEDEVQRARVAELESARARLLSAHSGEEIAVRLEAIEHDLQRAHEELEAMEARRRRFPMLRRERDPEPEPEEETG